MKRKNIGGVPAVTLYQKSTNFFKGTSKALAISKSE